MRKMGSGPLVAVMVILAAMILTGCATAPEEEVGNRPVTVEEREELYKKVLEKVSPEQWYLAQISYSELPRRNRRRAEREVFSGLLKKEKCDQVEIGAKSLGYSEGEVRNLAKEIAEDLILKGYIVIETRGRSNLSSKNIPKFIIRAKVIADNFGFELREVRKATGRQFFLEYGADDLRVLNRGLQVVGEATISLEEVVGAVEDRMLEFFQYGDSDPERVARPLREATEFLGGTEKALKNERLRNTLVYCLEKSAGQKRRDQENSLNLLEAISRATEGYEVLRDLIPEVKEELRNKARTLLAKAQGVPDPPSPEGE